MALLPDTADRDPEHEILQNEYLHVRMHLRTRAGRHTAGRHHVNTREPNFEQQ
jgi:hypothetical protein